MNTQTIDETNWSTLTSDEFDEIDSQVRTQLNGGSEVATLGEYAELFCTLANKAVLQKNELPGRVIGNRHTPNQNDAPEYYTEAAQ